MSECRQWNRGSVCRLQINISKRFRALLELRRHLHHNVILVEWKINRGHQTLSERVVESIVQGLWRDPQPAGRIPVDHKPGLKPLVLLIGILVSELAELPHFLQ